MIVDQHLHLENGPYTPENYPLSWLESYLETAKRRGVERLGIVEHAYRFNEARGLLPNAWADAQCLYSLDAYWAFTERARQAGLPVSFGLEMDYIPGKEEGIEAFLARYPWDFVLGSVHFLGDKGLDLPEHRDLFRTMERREIWDAYFRTSQLAVESGLFHVLTHPDLPKIFGEHPTHDLSEDYAQMARALKKADMAIEINTAGWRKPVGEVYPKSNYLSAALSEGVPLSMGSDAHQPGDVGADFDRAVDIVRGIGYRETVHFRGKRRLSTPL